MKKSIIILALFFIGCTDLSLADQISQLQKEREEQFKILNVNDGVSEIEALFLSGEYFDKYVSGCGMPLPPKDAGDYWEVEFFVGIAGLPLEEKMKINKKSGKIELKGYLTIDDPMSQLSDETENLVERHEACPENFNTVASPANLIEAFARLNVQKDKDEIEKFKNHPEDKLGEYHFGFGRWLRNEWGLWSGSQLNKYFKATGVNHPDEMSFIIIVSYHRYLNGKDIELEEQIENIKSYYK